MKNDQIVRSVGMIAIVSLYAVFLTMNGHGRIQSGVPGIGTIHALVLCVGAIFGLAFPEFVHGLPIGPTRTK